MRDFADYYAAIAADNAWMAELVRLYGPSHASHIRYTKRGQGEPGSTLNALYLDFYNKSAAWRQVINPTA